MPQPQQSTANSHATTTFSRRHILDWISLCYSRRLSLHDSLRPVTLHFYKFSARTAQKKIVPLCCITLTTQKTPSPSCIEWMLPDNEHCLQSYYPATASGIVARLAVVDWHWVYMSHYFKAYLMTLYKLLLRNQDIAVNMVTGCGLDDWGVGFQVPVGSRIVCSPQHPDRLGANPSSYSMNTRCTIPGGKAFGAWSWPSPPTSAEVMKT